MAVLAHAGDWRVNLIYVAPVVIVVGWLAVQRLLDRRRARRKGSDESA